MPVVVGGGQALVTVGLVLADFEDQPCRRAVMLIGGYNCQVIDAADH